MSSGFVFESKNSSLNNVGKYCFEDYLKDFDYLKIKYLPFYDSIQDNSFELPDNLKKTLEEFEKAYRYSSIVKRKYNYIEDNLYLVYGDREMVHNDTLAYCYVMNNFINKYLSIPQLNKMFDEDYFNFEWDMHVDQNFREHRNDYNRDHFIHQMRDLYMMMVLINKFGFFEATDAVLRDEKNGKIAEFTIKKSREFELDRSLPVKDMLDSIRGDVEKLVKANFKDNNEKTNLMHDRCADEKSYKEHFFYKYVIFAGSILAALFHDMGYPICHFLEIRQRVSEYNPTMYMFTHNAIDSFDQLASKLSDSLLFKIVSASEIKQSLNMDSKTGRYNHGAYSAIAFLLQFYNNGAIYSLTPEKQCAIELAAVAIYNHTASFSCVDDSKDATYYQPVFNQNPISFLLRFCDDLQEWDRRYFEFFSDTDLSFCKDCYSPYIPENNENQNDNMGKYTNYKCLCPNSSVFKSNSFLRRKLYVVRVSDSVSVEQKGKMLIFNVNYDLYKLLKVSRINSTYAKYRAKELNSIKKLIRDQDFIAQSGEKLNFKKIYIDFFMTSNPILIKIKMLERYMLLNEKAVTRSTLKKLNLEDVFNDIFDEKSIDKKIFLYMNEKSKDGRTLFDFYKELLLCCVNNINKHLECDEINKIVNSLVSKKCFDDFYCKCLRELIYDCIYQYSISLSVEDTDFEANKNYYIRYECEKNRESMLDNNISVFCNSDNKFNKEHTWGNYYTDLFFFYKLNEKINSIENNSQIN